MTAGNRDREFSAFPVVLGHAVKEEPTFDESFFDVNVWTALYEVLDIKILHVGTKDSVEVYGKIIFHTSTGFVFLFNREKNDPETVNLPGGAITLTNPKIGVNGWCRTGMSFELGGDLEELNREFLNWFPYNKPFDTLLTTKFKGSNCSMSVTYIVFTNAILANLEIMLLGGEEEEKKEDIDDDEEEKEEEDDEEEEKGEDKDHEEEKEGNATICGEITASFSKWPGLTFTLFDKKSDECVSVSEKGVIPLYKSVIAVPFASDLDIKVNLLVAAGKVRFSPRCFGDYVGTIADQIRVKVTFWDWCYHPETLIADNNFKIYNYRSDEEEEEEEVVVEVEEEEEEEDEEEDTGSDAFTEMDYYLYCNSRKICQ